MALIISPKDSSFASDSWSTAPFATKSLAWFKIWSFASERSSSSRSIWAREDWSPSHSSSLVSSDDFSFSESQRRRSISAFFALISLSKIACFEFDSWTKFCKSATSDLWLAVKPSNSRDKCSISTRLSTIFSSFATRSDLRPNIVVFDPSSSDLRRSTACSESNVIFPRRTFFANVSSSRLNVCDIESFSSLESFLIASSRSLSSEDIAANSKLTSSSVCCKSKMFWSLVSNSLAYFMIFKFASALSDSRRSIWTVTSRDFTAYSPFSLSTLSRRPPISKSLDALSWLRTEIASLMLATADSTRNISSSRFWIVLVASLTLKTRSSTPFLSPSTSWSFSLLSSMRDMNKSLTFFILSKSVPRSIPIKSNSLFTSSTAFSCADICCVRDALVSSFSPNSFCAVLSCAQTSSRRSTKSSASLSRTPALDNSSSNSHILSFDRWIVEDIIVWLAHTSKPQIQHNTTLRKYSPLTSSRDCARSQLSLILDSISMHLDSLAFNWFLNESLSKSFSWSCDCKFVNSALCSLPSSNLASSSISTRVTSARKGSISDFSSCTSSSSCSKSCTLQRCTSRSIFVVVNWLRIWFNSSRVSSNCIRIRS